MSEKMNDSNGARRPYRKPLIRALGPVAAKTLDLKKTSVADTGGGSPSFKHP